VTDSGRKLQARQRLAAQIRADLAGAVQGIVQAGQHLREAYGVVGRHGWSGFLQDCGLSGPMASKLIAIAAHPVLGDFSHCENLPPSVETIYQLTFTDAESLAVMIDVGDITPGTTRFDAKSYARAYPRKPRRGKRPGPDYNFMRGLVDQIIVFAAGFNRYEEEVLSDVATNARGLRPRELAAIRAALEAGISDREMWLSKLPADVTEDDDDPVAEGTAASG